MSMPSEVLHQSCWAKSASGACIELYSAKNGAERPLLFIGGVHGDEPEGVVLAKELLSWLQKNNSLQLYSWMLIPCLNVDGYKNNQRTNGRGVDLNRNFPSPDWSSEAKSLRYYPGRGPGSEPEIQALVDLIRKSPPSLIIHFHSWEPCVVYTGKPGQKSAETLALGTPYPVREDIGYPTPGSLGQYGWLVHQVPVICIEAQEKSQLDTVWPQFQLGLQTLLSQRPVRSKLKE